MLIEKNIYCFYTLKIDISISFPTTWYSDIVYSDQLVRMHAFGKHFSRSGIKFHAWRGKDICQESKI